MAPWLFIFLATLVGLVIGSFLNVVVYRLPIMLQREWRSQSRELLTAEGIELPAPSEEEPFNLVTPRSCCPHCKTPIKAWQNVPLISFAILRGRCAACGAQISWRYPIVELLTGLLSGLVAWHFGFGMQAFGAILLTWALISLTLIDIDTQLLPDVITLPLLWLGAGFALVYPAPEGFTTLPESIVGAIAGYLSLWSVYHLFKLVTGKEGMGYGDFKLLGALGAWLGWKMLFPIILLSALVGAVTGIAMIVVRGRDRQLPIPFGPFLAAAGFIALLWGPELLARYLEVSGL